MPAIPDKPLITRISLHPAAFYRWKKQPEKDYFSQYLLPTDPDLIPRMNLDTFHILIQKYLRQLRNRKTLMRFSPVQFPEL